MKYQDYALFDPFLYHGLAEIHDRHREMRLDVDNMSYEVKRDIWSELFSVVSSNLRWGCRNCWHWRSV